MKLEEHIVAPCNDGVLFLFGVVTVVGPESRGLVDLCIVQCSNSWCSNEKG